MIEIEFNLLAPDELELGIFMAYGENAESKQFHMVTLGFLIFSVNIIRYIKDADR
jgi:hypothetical protein